MNSLFPIIYIGLLQNWGGRGQNITPNCRHKGEKIAIMREESDNRSGWSGLVFSDLREFTNSEETKTFRIGLIGIGCNWIPWTTFE